MFFGYEVKASGRETLIRVLYLVDDVPTVSPTKIFLSTFSKGSYLLYVCTSVLRSLLSLPLEDLYYIIL
jgi:hypothetical protein